MQRSVRENIALPFTAPLRSLGPDRRTRRERRGSTAPIETLQIDTRAAGRGPAPVGRQPAEGDDRALGRGRRPDDALLRPDARHRHRHQAPDLRAPARPRGGGRGGPALHLGAQGDPARLRPGDRHLRRPGRGRDPRRGRRRADAPARRVRPAARCRRCPRRSPRPSWRPRATPSRRRPRRRHERGGDRGRRRDARRRPRSSACNAAARRNAWTLGLLGLLVGDARVHQAHPAELRPGPDPGPGDRGPADRVRRGRPGDRRHLRAASTCRSARSWR